MKNNTALLFFFVIICTTCKYNPREHLVGEIKKVSNNRFFFDEDVVDDKIYLNKKKDAFFEVPLLPYGFFLIYDDNQPFPVLYYAKPNNNLSARLYNRIGIYEIYLYKYFMIVKLVDSNKFVKIYFLDASAENIYVLPKYFYTKYSFKELTNDFVTMNNIITSTSGVQDRNILKNANVNFATPIVGAIISAGIFYKNEIPFLIGETIYSQYLLNLMSGDIRYFSHVEEFKSFLDSTDYNKRTIEIIDFSYKKYAIKKKEGKRMCVFYKVE
ncbi:hypothetical protein EZS27_025349 [termite gut metagenome]|uniref:Uncharacterized protein n=1 Tax=termite gut metagenome TaxID=433724 RepID=A0A5J4QU79_9ZZZZ